MDILDICFQNKDKIFKNLNEPELDSETIEMIEKLI